MNRIVGVIEIAILCYITVLSASRGPGPGRAGGTGVTIHILYRNVI